MDADKVLLIKQQLLREKRRLREEAGKALTDLYQEPNREELADFSDQSSQESDKSFLLRLKERERNLLFKIERALERIEEGTFGICEECGCEISEKRLQARPVVTLCIACKTEQERKEKAR